MTTKQKRKEDIVCAFHGGLEGWMKSIDKQLNEGLKELSEKVDSMRLFNAKIVGGLVVINIGLVIVLKAIRVI